MKTKIINIIIIVLFITVLFNFDYILIFLGKINVSNYQENKTELKTLKNENKQLKNELNDVLILNKLDQYQEYDYLKSNVLLRDVYTFNSTLTIRYGKDQNIKRGMAVVNDKGLIGIISKVNKKSSVVSLLSSNNVNVSIDIDENYGALTKYDANKKMLIAHNFNNYEIIMKNDEVYTSGLGLIPKGLYIGKVNATKNINANIEQSVAIKSDVDFNNIKYVAIIKGIKEL